MRRLVPVSVLCVALLVGCGSDSKESADTTADSSATSAPADSVATEKPEVKIPATMPTELVVTDLVVGTGAPAKSGDTVEVNYVGVRSADGTEFDNSYDRGQTYPVVLGTNGVIKGWEDGLLGIKAGGRRQLDIPAELAYGDNPPAGSPIQAGDALSFVIDAVSITPGVELPIADPADKPTVDIPTSTGATDVAITELVEGTGDLAKPDQTAYVQLTAYRGDTGEELQSTWTTGNPATITLDQQTIPGLVEGIEGMKVGGRRLVVIPFKDAFGADGRPDMGLPASTDLIFVIDLVMVADPQ